MDPQEIVQNLETKERELLNKILLIEKNYQHISELSSTREQEIVQKIKAVIEREMP